MKRIINLEIAIEKCRKNKATFRFESTAGAHIKFYVGAAVRFILISRNNENPDRVRRDIRKALKGVSNG